MAGFGPSRTGSGALNKKPGVMDGGVSGLSEKRVFWAVFSSSLFLACGLTAMALGGYLGNYLASQTGEFLRIWEQTGLMIVVGVISLVAAILLGSNKRRNFIIGAAVGAIASLAGVIVAFLLLITFTGIPSFAYASVNTPDTQGIILFLAFVISSLLSAFVGFPFGLAASIATITEKEESPSAG